MKKILIAAAACTALICGSAFAQETKVDPLHVDVLMKFAFSQAPKDWAGRTDQDETMKVCSATRNAPSAEQAAAIMTREKTKIKYPEDGKLLGDWNRGEISRDDLVQTMAGGAELDQLTHELEKTR